MKKTITKKLLTFILLVSGMFSFSPADAQLCVCSCAPKPKNNAECFTRPNGNPGCRPYGGHLNCARVAGEQTIETSSLSIYPNPVSASTTVSFYVEETKNVSVKVFDMSGRLVTTLTDASFEEGYHEIIWNAAEVNAGIYFLRMEAGDYSVTEKLSVVK